MTWHSALAIPILAATDVAATAAATAAALVMTAPNPTIASSVVVTAATLVATAPDPSAGGLVELDTAAILVTAPDPEQIGEGSFAIPGSVIGLIAHDPTFVQPSRLYVTSAMANATAPDPAIDYGFVSSTTGPAFPGVPQASTRGDEHRRQIASALNRTLSGKIGCTGTFTLLPNVPATFWRDARLGAESWVQFDPLTADAQAEATAGTMYVLEADRQDGQWLITHANDASADRKFRFSILG